MRTHHRPIHAVSMWVRRQPPKVKAFLAVISGMAALVLLRFIVHDHDNLFVAAEAVHSIGISVLIYKLTREKTCAGLSLKSQELTAIFLAVRLYCSFVMEYDIHTLLDWPHWLQLYGSCFSFTPVASDANTKIVEPFTAHYVFALGVARFLSCAHWVLQVLDSRGHLLVALGYGLWPSMVLISEIVQTFILADFCYYYIKSVFGGQLVLRLPSGSISEDAFFFG
ncbi:Detected protein of confused Function [Hibiscus syriacus]|uniref:Detected protein of confused Function n=1 Tax=Hibiscus syriacus TaxID=106335 RepID=A0A6A3AWW7_HIBSY|nr:Detected protein of confused Function [Hibiscus syriacus]